MATKNEKEMIEWFGEQMAKKLDANSHQAIVHECADIANFTMSLACNFMCAKRKDPQ